MKYVGIHRIKHHRLVESIKGYNIEKASKPISSHQSWVPRSKPVLETATFHIFCRARLMKIDLCLFSKVF